MKLLVRIPLHWQIIVGLILGAVFGTIFSIDQSSLRINYLVDNELREQVIDNISKVTFNYNDEEENQIIKSFSISESTQLINFFKNLKPKERQNNLKIHFNNQSSKKELELANIESISKGETIVRYFKPFGTLFIRLLSFLAIPLVIASLIVGAASLDDIKKLGRIGIKTFSIYIATTAIAITIGLSVANIIKPGEIIDVQTKNNLIGEFHAETSEKIIQELNIDVIDFFVNIVPKNPINAMADGNMLQIVFFAVMFGITLTFIDKKKSGAVIDFFSGISETMIKMVDFIMLLAPIGVFALMGSTIAEFGFGIISTLIWYILAVLLGLFIHTTVTYPLIVKFIGRTSVIKYFKGIRSAQVIGFSTSSSAATLPVTFDCAERNIGLPKQITGFVLPLGATINMDGTALYQGVAAVFIAQVYGFDLNIIQQLTIVFTAVLASIGTAPVPGVGIIMLVIILQAIHIPAEGIALILGVDRILDMCRTITNVSGDVAVAVAVSGSEKVRAKKIANK